MQLKTCNNCKEEKPATPEFFNVNKQGRHGLRGQCKPCWKARVRGLIQRPEIKATRAAYYQKTRENGLAAERAKNWVERNPEKRRAMANKSRIKHKEKRDVSAAEWRAANPDKVKAYRKITAQRQQQNPEYVLHKRTKARLRALLKGEWRGKTEQILGYTRAQLATHIESLFSEGMSWEILMTGAIHIDHIRPVSSFEITGPECAQFKECWALSNLRPMWAKDNQKKSNKWEPSS